MGKSNLFGSKVALLPSLVKLRLFIRSRKQGSYIASVPLKRLGELAGCRYRNWRIEEVDGGFWLILEAS
jgi:hypothetical protein